MIFQRNHLFRLLIVVAVILAATPLQPPETKIAYAANGDPIHKTYFSIGCTSGIGVGIAFDGNYIWYSCYQSNPDLFKADAYSGTVVASYNVAGGLGALAWDNRRKVIWAGWGGGSGSNGDIRQIDPDNGNATVIFNATTAAFIDLDDGLAYDIQDDSLYISPDTSTSVFHYSTAGDSIDNFSWAGNECYNSGVAIGGDLLFEGSNGCDHVWVVKRSDHSPVFDFSTIVGNDPSFRDEDLECDSVTFAPKTVMWSVEAYEPRRAVAFEIPSGTCQYGGGGLFQLPFKPAKGHSSDGLDSVYSWFDHEYPLLPPGPPLYGSEPTVAGVGDTVMRYDGQEKPDCPNGKPDNNHYCYSGHNGYDFTIGLNVGTAIYAATAGTVITGHSSCIGYYVYITTDDGLYQTRYLHLGSNITTATHVSAGDQIGTIGPKYPCTTGPHLHFGVYFDQNGNHKFEPDELVDPYYSFPKYQQDPWTQPFTDSNGKSHQGATSKWLWNFSPPSSASLNSTTASLLGTSSGVSMLIPQGAVTGTATLDYAIAPDPISSPYVAAAAQSNSNIGLTASENSNNATLAAGHVFKLTAAYTAEQPIESLLIPGQLTIRYSNDDVNAVNEASLAIYHWDEAGTQWTAILTSLDQGSKQAKASISQLGLYSLRGASLTPAPEIKTVFPSQAGNQQPVTISISGTNIISPTYVNLGITSLQVLSSTSTSVIAVVPAGLPPGAYDLRLQNPDGQATLSLNGYTSLAQIFLPLIQQDRP